jgi:hypothetical protein
MSDNNRFEMNSYKICMANKRKRLCLSALLLLIASSDIAILSLGSECMGVAQSVSRLAMDWKVRLSTAGGGEIFRTHPDRAWGLPSLLYNGFLFFPGAKAEEARRWPLTPSSVEIFASCSRVNFTLSVGSEEVLTSFVLRCIGVALRCMRPSVVWDVARRRSAAAYRRFEIVC